MERLLLWMAGLIPWMPTQRMGFGLALLILRAYVVGERLRLQLLRLAVWMFGSPPAS